MLSSESDKLLMITKLMLDPNCSNSIGLKLLRILQEQASPQLRERSDKKVLTEFCIS